LLADAGACVVTECDVQCVAAARRFAAHRAVQSQRPALTVTVAHAVGLARFGVAAVRLALVLGIGAGGNCGAGTVGRAGQGFGAGFAGAVAQRVAAHSVHAAELAANAAVIDLAIHFGLDAALAAFGLGRLAAAVRRAILACLTVGVAVAELALVIDAQVTDALATTDDLAVAQAAIRFRRLPRLALAGARAIAIYRAVEVGRAGRAVGATGAG